MKYSGLIVLLLVLSGCSWFSKDDKEVDSTEPAKLLPFEQEVTLKSLWSKSIGKGADDKAIRLVPALAGSRVFVASADGNIMALQSSDGREIWKVRVEEFYPEDERKQAFGKDVDVVTGGIGVGGDMLAVGTAAGEILALNQSDGSLAWRSRTTSEVLAPPQIHRDLVVVHSIDGKISAYNALDGERQWLYSTTIPSLTLRGTSTPIVTDEFIAAGFSNGRFALLDRERGIAGFEQRVGVAQGRSDLERLVDIDGTMLMVGSRLFLAGYQGSVLAFNAMSGTVVWNREASSVVGLGEGFGNVYIGHADSRLGALDAENGKDVWEIDTLLNRHITTPVAVSSYVVVGDVEGYLHVIAQSDGRTVGRKKVDGDGIYSPVLADAGRVYVLGNSGKLSLFELR
jgi:outer membrane protein assembly factor BamB